MIWGILVLIFIGLLYLWDRETIDKKSVPLSSADIETTQLNNERKGEMKGKLEKKVRKLNEDNPGRVFYRDGPRIKEKSSQEIKKAESAAAECDRLNAPYATHQPHYRIDNGEVVHVGDHVVRVYKCEEMMRIINNDFSNDILCRADLHSMKLIDSITGEEIPFNPDEYTLTGKSHLS
jgi:hypothetical protein